MTYTALSTHSTLQGKSREIRLLFADTANEALTQGRSESEAIFKALNVVKLKEQQSIKKFVPQVVPAHLSAILNVHSASNLAQEAQEQLEKEKAIVDASSSNKDIVGASFTPDGKLVLKFKDGTSIKTNQAPVTAVEHNVVVVGSQVTNSDNATTDILTTSEPLIAGNWVNVWNDSGAKVRKADATTIGKEVHGFVLSSYAAGTLATVQFDGFNTAVTGQSVGTVFLSPIAGEGTNIAPSAIGNIVQRLGFAISATSVNFNPQQPTILA